MTESARMEEKVDAILEAVNKINLANAKFEQRFSEIEQITRDNHTAIKGNGKPGLEVKVALLEENLMRVNWVGALLLVAVIGDAISRILAAAR